MTELGPFMGAPLDSVKSLQAQFEADVQRWEAGNIPFNELATPAFGYWIGYPLFLEQVGFEWRDDPVRSTAYFALNHAHLAATHFLMEAAERLGIDSTLLAESSQLCQRLFTREGWKHFSGICWPECVEETTDALSIDEHKTIRKGHAVIQRLSVKIGIDLEGSDGVLLARLRGLEDDKAESVRTKTGKKKRGRKTEEKTIHWADFAKPRIAKSLGWTDVYCEYRQAHPEDRDASADKIRLAYHRQYPAT